MKLNVKLLSLVFVLFAGLFIVSCANEESSTAANGSDAASLNQSPQEAEGMSSLSQASQNLDQAQNMNQDMATNNPNPNAGNADAGPKTSISFDKTTHDFGTLIRGEKAEYKYEFTNTGNEPLIISNVRASCGCTAPSYSKDPVAPGEKGFIDVEYSATGSGDVSKNVTITANTEPATTMIYLTANVVAE